MLHSTMPKLLAFGTYDDTGCAFLWGRSSLLRFAACLLETLPHKRCVLCAQVITAMAKMQGDNAGRWALLYLSQPPSSLARTCHELCVAARTEQLVITCHTQHIHKTSFRVFFGISLQGRYHQRCVRLERLSYFCRMSIYIHYSLHPPSTLLISERFVAISGAMSTVTG